jgi:hypothetical protein
LLQPPGALLFGSQPPLQLRQTILKQGDCGN